MESFFVNTLLPIGLILVIITVALAILAGVVKSLQNPKSALKSIIAFVVLAVIFFIAYSTADPSNPSNKEVTESVSLMASAGITTVIVFLIGAIAATVFSAVMDFIK